MWVVGHFNKPNRLELNVTENFLTVLGSIIAGLEKAEFSFIETVPTEAR